MLGRGIGKILHWFLKKKNFCWHDYEPIERVSGDEYLFRCKKCGKIIVGKI